MISRKYDHLTSPRRAIDAAISAEKDIDRTECVLMESCKREPCGNDVFMLPGALERDMAYDNLFKFANWTYDHHDSYACFPPYNKCKHDVKCISDDLRREIMHISGEEPVSIVGMCYGGMVAQQYAADWPDSTEKIALIVSGLFNDITLDWIEGNGMDKESVDSIRATDFEAIAEKVKADVFTYNCDVDRVLIDPPVIDADVEEHAWYCLHWFTPPYVFDRVQEFLDNE